MSDDKRAEDRLKLAEEMAAPEHDESFQAANDETDEIPDGPPGDPVELALELQLAQAEVADLKDKLLRAMAELENVRRRAERDKTDARKFAVTEFARDVLSVPDNLQRALDAAPESGQDDGSPIAKFVEGVQLTERELLSVLERHGISRINPVDEKLDPNRHQAMVQVDHPEAAAGTIIDVMQVGYVLNDRLLRPALVAVAKGPASDESEYLTAGQKIDTSA